MMAHNPLTLLHPSQVVKTYAVRGKEKKGRAEMWCFEAKRVHSCASDGLPNNQPFKHIITVPLLSRMGQPVRRIECSHTRGTPFE